MPAGLVRELQVRGGVTAQAAEAWAGGVSCNCQPLQAAFHPVTAGNDTDG